MKKIGIIGGLSWHSSIDYYRYLNEMYQDKANKDSSASIILNSLDIESIAKLFKSGKAEEKLLSEVKILEKSGCEIILIASNTVHYVFDYVEKKTTAHCIHIADSCSKKLKELGVKNISLLATKYTIEKPFYNKRLKKNGYNLIQPTSNQIDMMQGYIESELTLGNSAKMLKPLSYQ